MDYARLKTEYLCYLMNLVEIEAEGPNGYLELCQLLHKTSFIPILSFDENRCEECDNLRSRFSEEDGDILNDILPLSGTMMELLVVLTERISYETDGSPYESNPRKWFTEMLRNSGLDYMTNSRFKADPDGTKAQVMDILMGINMRWFGWDGQESFFPLHMPKSDQRETEIIVQMNNYIEENYDFS